MERAEKSFYEEKCLTLSDEEIKKIVLDSKKRKSSGSVSIFKKGNILWNKDKKGYNINKGKIVLNFDLNKNMLQRFNNLQDAANSVSFHLNGEQKKGNLDLISVAIKKKTESTKVLFGNLNELSYICVIKTKINE